MFSLAHSDATHAYQPVSSYLCTVPPSCFDLLENDEVQTAQQSILTTDHSSTRLVTATHVLLKSTSVSFIQNLLDNQCNTTVITISDDDTSVSHADHTPINDHWLTIGPFVLAKKERQCILGGKELNDRLVSVFLYLSKLTFPNIAGLQNTVLQQREDPKIPRQDGQMLLQIIHIRQSHWAAFQMVNSSEVLLYDSAYSTISMDTVDVITKLIRSMESTITMQVMNVPQQAGAVDCALYAMAAVTCLALGNDPVVVVYDQQQLRAHLLNVLETGSLTEFPVLKRRRVASRIKKSEKFQLHCYCRLRDDGTKMVCCDGCNQWYHLRCIKIDVNSIDADKWFCKNCI